jgi:MATE family multidrug resistance protein
MDNMEPSTGATPLQDQALAVQSAGAADGPWRRQRQLAVAEAKRLLRLGGPIIISCLLMNLLNVVSIMVVGHLGEVRLAGVSLAISLANVTGYIVLVRTSI